MVTSIRVVGSGLTDLRTEVTQLQAASSSQLKAMEDAVTILHNNTYEMNGQLSNLEAEHGSLRASVLEQMTSINEAVEAQTGLIKMHDQAINELKTDTSTSAEAIKTSLETLQANLTSVETDLTSRGDEWKIRFDQMASMVSQHDGAVGQMSSQLEKLNLEFRGVLQTVDDQVRPKFKK